MERPDEPRQERRTIGEVDADRLFRALAAWRRRAALAYLRRADTPVTCAQLAAEIAHREVQAESVALDGEKWSDVETALAHSHLPILDDLQLVEYDEEERLVALGERSALAWPLLDAMDEAESGGSGR